jgi:hypothetical protein
MKKAQFTRGALALAMSCLLFACSRQYDLLKGDETQREKERHQPKSSTWIDALGERILPHLDRSYDTQFSPGFRERSFQELQAGSSRDDLVRALGEPLEKVTWDDGYSWWYYSKHGKAKSYFIRIVILDKRGAVVAKVARFYMG